MLWNIFWNLFRNMLGNMLWNMVKKRTKIKPEKTMAEKKTIMRDEEHQDEDGSHTCSDFLYMIISDIITHTKIVPMF